MPILLRITSCLNIQSRFLNQSTWWPQPLKTQTMLKCICVNYYLQATNAENVFTHTVTLSTKTPHQWLLSWRNPCLYLIQGFDESFIVLLRTFYPDWSFGWMNCVLQFSFKFLTWMFTATVYFVTKYVILWGAAAQEKGCVINPAEKKTTCQKTLAKTGDSTRRLGPPDSVAGLKEHA